MCWQIPEWASGAANDRHHRAKQILASPIVTTYPQGSGCSVCVAQEKICTVSSDYVRCAYCTARGKRRALSQLPSTSAGAVGPWGKAMCPSADGEFALRMLLKFTYGALGIRSRSFRPNHGEEVW